MKGQVKKQKREFDRRVVLGKEKVLDQIGFKIKGILEWFKKDLLKTIKLTFQYIKIKIYIR